MVVYTATTPSRRDWAGESSLANGFIDDNLAGDSNVFVNSAVLNLAARARTLLAGLENLLAGLLLVVRFLEVVLRGGGLLVTVSKDET